MLLALFFGNVHLFMGSVIGIVCFNTFEDKKAARICWWLSGFFLLTTIANFLAL